MGTKDAKGNPQFRNLAACIAALNILIHLQDQQSNLNTWQGSVHDWFEKTYTGAAADKLHEDLKKLDAELRTYLGFPASPFQTTVPHQLFKSSGEVQEAVRFKIRLWLVAFNHKHHIKGTAAMHAVRDTLQTMIYGEDGPRTHKFPLEVLFNWPVEGTPTPNPGDILEPFKLSVAIGTAVTMAHYCFAVFSLRLDLMNLPMEEATKKALAQRLLRTLVLSCESCKNGSPGDVMQSACTTKMEANLRTRPTAVAFQKMFSAKLQEQPGIGDREDWAQQARSSIMWVEMHVTVKVIASHSIPYPSQACWI